MSLVDLGKRLLDAAKKGDTDEVRTLMANGAPFTTDWLGTSPLHFASQFGHVSTAEVLLRAGISRDARTKVDRTPLHVAAQEGHTAIVELLVRHGADIEAKDMLKMTPLHWSVEKAHIQVIEMLVKQGGDINCLNKFDKSPVEIAMSNGRTDIAQLLQMSTNIPIVEVTTEAPQAIEEVSTTSEAVASITSSPQMVHPSPVTIAAHMHESTLSTIEESPRHITIKPEDGTDQSSTSVLATLAALAEATGPLNASNSTNTTAADALNWLETQGITMISNSDAPTIVSSSLEGGHTLTLTEAGKLALNFVQQKDPSDTECEVIQETVIENDVVVQEDDGSQNVITIVSGDDVGAGDGENKPLIVRIPMEGDGPELDDDEPAAKKPKLEQLGAQTYIVTSDGPIDREALTRQLAQVQKQAAAYKQQLKEKAQEAEDYKKQLTEITAKTTP